MFSDADLLDLHRRMLVIRGFEEREQLGLDAGAVLFVEERRVQQERIVFGAEHAADFRDAALPQDQRLPSAGERPADHGPFFERDREHSDPFPA